MSERESDRRLALGAIADDFTGATDLADTLVREGLSCELRLGLPEGPPPETDAVVVALKSRTIPAADAVAQSLAVLEWLRRAGVAHVYFKYCSTFDSTDAGNIGPVGEALADALGAGVVPYCPAFPAAGRTLYLGYLFVGGALLSESGMRDHPLTPMRDPNLVRVLARQTRAAVGLVPFPVVSRGAEAVAAAFAAAAAKGSRHLVVDAVDEAHLRALGEAAAGLPLSTGGSGAALGLPEALRRRGLAGPRATAALPQAAGPAVVLAGSCSDATRGQVSAYVASGAPALALDPLALAEGRQGLAELLDWTLSRLERAPLVYSSAPPDAVRAVQERLGRDAAGRLVEESLAALAAALVERGVGRLVVAGGETSGAVASALGVTRLRIGPAIATGVPWTESLEGRPLALALKSGNFGGPDFFSRALGMLS